MGFPMKMTKDQLAKHIETEPGPLVSMARALKIQKTRGFEILFHLVNMEYPMDFERETIDRWVKATLKPEWNQNEKLYAAFVASYLLGGIHTAAAKRAEDFYAAQIQAAAQQQRPQQPGGNPLPRPPGFTGGAS